MINIRPVSDLRNKYAQIEDIVVNKKEPVIFTKNGYGSTILIDLQEYEKMKDLVEIIEDDEICRLLDEATENAKKNPKRLNRSRSICKSKENSEWRKTMN